jgi:hypothetical protein
MIQRRSPSLVALWCPEAGDNQMLAWIRREYPDFFAWLALTCAALIAVVISSGTSYHRLAVAVLISAVAWLVLIAVFEGAWELATAVLRASGLDGSKPAEPKGPHSRLR